MPEVGRRNNEELPFNGYAVSGGEGESILELNGGDRCTTVRMHVMPQTVHLTNG